VLQGVAEVSAVPVVGAGLSGPWRESATATGRQASPDASLAIRIGGGVRLSVGHSSAMGPLGALHAVTAAQGDRIETLGGQAARDVMLAAAGPGLAERVGRGELPVFLGIPTDAAATSLERNRYVVRSVLGTDPRNGALIVPHTALAGASVGFLVQDRQRARADFEALLDGVERGAGQTPGFGLYFNCAARGRDFYGEPDVDVSAIRRRFPGLPVIGLSGAYELCPTGGTNRMHAYTGVLVVVSPA
jgi:small ligand-binding sensory domain FIST